MSKLKFAAVDLGAESGRVVVGAFDGTRLQLQETHRFANVTVQAGSTLHWDALRLWSDIQNGLAEATAQHGELSSIGVDTWGVDFGLLDATGALIGNPVHYRDARNQGAMESAFETVAREEIFERTGLAFLPFNTLYQLLALKKQNPAQLEIAETLLLMPDLLNFWLTGHKAAEYSIASTSQMLDARTRTWDEELLHRLEIPTRLLPGIVAPGTTLGPLREELAKRLGMNANTRVIAPGEHDTASAVAAVPFSDSAEKGMSNGAYLSSGTWSLMGVELDEPLISPRVAELNFTNEGGVNGKIRFLKNIAGLWLVQECRRAWQRAGREYSYAQLTELAAQAKPFGAIVEPDDARFVAPASMPDALREYSRLSRQAAPQTEGEVVRCCLESLALKYRWTLEKLEELTGQKIPVLHIVGGGTQNKLLSQLTADAINRPVLCGPVEATAIGNILAQLMARGEISNLQDARAIVRRSFEIETFAPRREYSAQWDDAYEKFLRLITL
jgi:rhamnulokinase